MAKGKKTNNKPTGNAPTKQEEEPQVQKSDPSK